MVYISETAARKMLKDAGAERISEGALKEFRRHLERSSFETASRAVRLAHHAKRKTVEVSDVKLALG